MPDKLIIHTDGGARGNPGPAAIGVVIENESGEVLLNVSRYIGQTTNNQAEYQAVYTALKEAKNLGGKILDIYLDSELVVKQLKLEYKVKNKELAPIFMKVWNLAQEFKSITWRHILREKNIKADKLVNEALDKKISK